MENHINIGDRVIWPIGESVIEGDVIDTYHYKMSEETLTELNRQVDKAGRALLIQLTDGRKVLKLENEVNRKQ